MADRVMVVHHEREFAKRLTTALRHEGHDVTTYQDPMHALEALAAPQRVAVLVVPMQFPPGKPNGLALALPGPSQATRDQGAVLRSADRRRGRDGSRSVPASPNQCAERSRRRGSSASSGRVSPDLAVQDAKDAAR